MASVLLGADAPWCCPKYTHPDELGHSFAQWKTPPAGIRRTGVALDGCTVEEVRHDHIKIVNAAELVSGLRVLEPVPTQTRHFTPQTMTASACPQAGAVSLPLAISKQATNKKTPPDGDQRAGRLNQDYPASLGNAEARRLPDSR
jgi:hypothetical protein